jgi:hypothetical protein
MGIGRHFFAIVSACIVTSAVFAFALATAASAELCSSEHCYAIAYQETTGVIGNRTAMDTEGSDVYNWKNGFDRYNNEIWGVFPEARGGWVEIGQYAGASYGGQRESSCCALHYFHAHAYSSAGEGYTETDAPNGPTVDQTQEYSTQYSGIGSIWCVLLNGITNTCWEGYPSLSTLGYVGLEAHYYKRESLYNFGVAYNIETQLSNGAWYPWASDERYNATPGSHFCAYHPSEFAENALAFGSGGCEGEDVLFDERSLTQAPPMPGSDPFSSYEPPTGTNISLANQKSLSYEIAAHAGDTSPTDVVSTPATLNKASEAMDPGFVPGATESAGYARWLNSEVFVLTMRGNFTLEGAPVPQGDSEPSGTVLSVALDAKTGDVDMIHVGNRISSATKNLIDSGVILH